MNTKVRWGHHQYSSNQSPCSSRNHGFTNHAINWYCKSRSDESRTSCSNVRSAESVCELWGVTRFWGYWCGLHFAPQLASCGMDHQGRGSGQTCAVWKTVDVQRDGSTARCTSLRESRGIVDGGLYVSASSPAHIGQGINLRRGHRWAQYCQVSIYLLSPSIRQCPLAENACRRSTDGHRMLLH